MTFKFRDCIAVFMPEALGTKNPKHIFLVPLLLVLI